MYEHHVAMAVTSLCVVFGAVLWMAGLVYHVWKESETNLKNNSARRQETER